ncbi:MAG: 4-hydroxy-tetrahydrodipicolinate reductase [Alicyclobacillus herbarius]|uniref:4-hydroxy-tetrahydrodipicolinate reductase n=1 Tax=Alicyclobacillus herbarius TaxID=122960 RepID=UPI00041CDF70|nr:4-hydroxy-tetrahydrodipicolinate reductase [Alicyclobacillus herbarius]MCL6631430.1 4-hydroxy-tetrahydrodipicolinate reductase [Alicyclobacillus herbarius]
MENTIRVVIAGIHGKMGREAALAFSKDARFQVVGGLARRAGQAEGDWPVFTDKHELITETSPDVWLDLTDASSVVENVDFAITHGIRPVVGATGYTEQDVARWHAACLEREIGGIAAPNFAIGALLMMRFAREAARFMSAVEIIELHHDGKKDAPSGTAKRTAEQVASEVGHQVPIHSVRLPGLVAHQEVLFGGQGEVLTIRHDSLSRQSFMPGILTACAQVGSIRGLVYGLENILW